MSRANGRKRYRTKFTQNQRESMFEFAERVGWKLRKQDEELIIEFCSNIGVEKGVFKVWLHNNNKKNSRRATADILPECLIQKILCFLSFKEAAKMSVLSKTWLQASLTLPNLKLSVDYYDKMKIVDSILERYRDNKIHIDKFDFSDCSISDTREVFPIDKWLDIALQNGVKDLVYRDIKASYPFPIFKFLAAKYLRELVLMGCDLMHLSISASHVANCLSLRKLSLRSVHLDDNMLRTLLNSCPFIVVFILEYCSGLEKIELLNLQNIKSVSIRSQRQIYRLVKIQAPTLEHLSYYGYLSGKIDVAECQNLKSLDISHVTISDGFLQNLISRSQSLNVLKIQYCVGIREIDSSNLVSLEYMGYQIPELKIARESNQLKHSKIVFHCDENLNAAWFCKLRKFLLNSTSWSQVSLHFSKCKKINMNDLQLHHRVRAGQVDVLNLNIRSSRECPTFVDALLWSCHPRRLNLYSSSVKMFTCFMNHLIYMKNSNHSSSQRSKPWHNQLIEIKAFDGKNQPLRLRNGVLAISTLTGRKGVYFLLDWRCS